MVKNLVDRLKTGAKKAKNFAAAAGLSTLLLFNAGFSTGCKSIFSPDIEPPTANLSVSPESGGNAPLEMRIILNSSSENIVNYALYVNLANNSSSLLSKNDSGRFSGTAFTEEETPNRFEEGIKRISGKNRIQRDSGLKANESGKSGAETETQILRNEEQRGIHRDSRISQAYEMPDFERSLYSMAEKGIQLHRNITGDSLSSDEINETISSASPIDITRTYGNKTREEYTIIFKGEVTNSSGEKSPLVSKTVTVQPELDSWLLDLSEIDPDFDEEKEQNINLPRKNKLEEDVEYVSVTSPDNKVKIISFEDYVLKFKGEKDQIGEYKVELKFKNPLGEEYAQNIEGNISDLLDVTGFVEDCEKHSGSSGKVWVYDINHKRLGEVSADSLGRFEKQLEQKVVDLPGEIILQARQINPLTENNESYVRTVKLPAGDIRDFLIRVVPYDGLAENNISPEDFRRHMAEVVGSVLVQPTEDTINLNPIIYKWDFGIAPGASSQLDEIIISKTPNSLPANEYFFTPDTAEYIRNRILDKNDIGSWFEGKINSSTQVNIVENHAYDSNADSGKIIVYPYNGSLGGITDNGDGYVDVGKVSIKVVKNEGKLVEGPGLAHEFGHVSGLMGHAWTIPGTKTIMWWDGRDSSWVQNYPRVADKKTAKALYEDTFIHGYGFLIHPESGIPNLLGLNDILGLGFYDN